MPLPAAAALLLTLAFAGACSSAERPPNVLLIVIDTLRADRLSSYGYRRPTSPHLDALAERGIRFANAASTASWTLPAHASLFTGLLPIEHGATQEHHRLPEGPATLAEVLRERGYGAFAVSANPIVGKRTGLDRGFARVVETWRLPKSQPPPDRHPNLLAAQKLLEEWGRERPFLLFVNFIEPHGRYEPPEPFRSRFLAQEKTRAGEAAQPKSAEYYMDPETISDEDFAALNDLYDGEVAYSDAIVGAFVERLAGAGWLENTLVVITSDHGENIGDHGHYRHVFSLYNTTVRVPLIVLLPEGQRAGEVRHEPVSLVDVFATIVAATGASEPKSGGIDLLGDPGLAASRPRIAEQYYPLHALRRFPPEQLASHQAQLEPHLRRLRSIEDGGLRFIWSSDGRHELYDLERDPGETRDLADDEALAERRRALAARLAERVERAGGPRPLPERAAPAPAAGDLDAETLERLRDLGYVH